MNPEPTPDQTLGSLLRGELAAVESYGEAIRCFPELAAHPLLEGVRADHNRAAETLKTLIIAEGGHPPQVSEPWECLTALADPTEVFTPKSPALAAFKRGEKDTVSQYRRALEDASLPQPAQAVIRDELLPLAWKNWLYVEAFVA